MKKLFLDTEFTGLHQNTTVISIGIVSENNQSFYAEFTDYDSDQVNEWINENVIENLQFNHLSGNQINVFEEENNHLSGKGNAYVIQQYLREWLNRFDQ